MDLKNKIALVTGGARGIGLAIVIELLRNEVKHATIVDLRKSDGEESAKKLNAEFGEGRAIFVACDVTKAGEFEAAFAKTVKEFGGLDIVVNNAGVLGEQRWESTVDINVNGVIRGTLLGIEYMGKHKDGKGGLIVNTASIFGLEPVVWGPVYVATKHAIVGLSRSFGTPYYCEKTGVKVVSVCPGVTETPLLNNIPLAVSDLMDTEMILTDMTRYPVQQSEDVARGMVRVIESAKNGSVWVIEGEEPAYEVFIPDRLAIKSHQK